MYVDWQYIPQGDAYDVKGYISYAYVCIHI